MSLKLWRLMEQGKRERLSALISNPYSNLGLRLFIGVIFLLSATSKLPHHVEFEAVVKEYEILPDVLASAYANALPWVELLVGVYLITGVLMKTGAILTLLMGISFMVANIKSIVQGEALCGDCFGEVWSLPVEQAIWFAQTAAVLALESEHTVPEDLSLSKVLHRLDALNIRTRGNKEKL